ncbi:type VI secretion system lysozyme-related protein (plasmid) [Rhizobium phaseoli]|uniref:Type VI secretion system baseplate subunit TssE n=1 Tax=Rhizobium phaseoli TaxID=396 RepID=A0A7X6F2G0_9HYPH|nr:MULTISPECIES: type VI secretion system baseplate subunit TssE [Rhizobium]ANL51163.1 type VI secretion system lysozyme-related protein [Rhizobium phaseoli]MDE8757656.1 type VI secretion system baseplate subunit TssE [Rhizobium sp. CBK13]NKF11417.1 type VI secretion system baseplate subunit TssE [Rhizobium phaseoli]QPK13247.1 type VI secretion system baseplate subunit TssE [Rhizobium phaseoli]
MSASDGWRKEVGRESRPLGGHQRATRETIQPSLWDRLVNDLPGLGSEIKDLRQILQSEIDAERLDAMVAGGVGHIESATDLSIQQKKNIHRLFSLERRRLELDSRGVVVSSDVLREAVRRDIEALFNVQRFESSLLLTDAEAELVGENPPSLEDFPQVRRSVVNYGVPPFSGRSSRDFDREELAKEITQVLAAFEPRLKEGATKVTVSLGDKSIGLRIDIDALLLTTPAPERLRIRTILDLDNGSARTELKDT